MGLALCPCGSGVVYEECCYKINGVDGSPLFFKGAMSGDVDGSWHPLPNVRFAAIIVGEAGDKYRDYAKELVSKSKLAEKHHKDFVNVYGLFYHSYEQLLKGLSENSGKGVSFQMDTIEARANWKQFLLNGRILIDFVGLYSRGALGLNQKIGGLNRKKFASLLTILEKQGGKDKRLLEVKKKLESLGYIILDFIDIRDEEKSNDTIVKFPTVDYEYGITDEGEIKLKTKSYKMLSFVEYSYNAIRDLTCILFSISL